MKDNTVPKFMRAKQLAEHLGIGLSTVWLYAKQGKITPKKISDRVTLFEVAEVEKALLGA
ncbi:helix-turn-helix transcriptional regulator [Aliarcobacter lanthieri]|uniref:helix-turn-helix transcriptional regulator n=1 Tax=Aliarcobacter lanthieri TaxID=1355374 RepID=UPI003AFA94EE